MEWKFKRKKFKKKPNIKKIFDKEIYIPIYDEIGEPGPSKEELKKLGFFREYES